MVLAADNKTGTVVGQRCQSMVRVGDFTMIDDNEAKILAGQSLPHWKIAAFLAIEDDEQLAVLDSQMGFLAADLDGPASHTWRIGPMGSGLEREDGVGYESISSTPDATEGINSHLSRIAFLHRFW